MATLSNAPRITTSTLASATAGPFNVGFRLFDPEAIAVTVNGAARTDFTLSASFSGGYTDTATISFTAPLSIGDVLEIAGAMEAARGADITGTGTVRQLNIELPRLWAAIADWKRPISTLTSSVASALAAAINAAASAMAAQTAETNAETAEANAEAWAGTVNSTFLQTSGQRCTLGGTANAITITTGGSVVSVVAGQRFRALATAANTGAATLAVDGLSAVSILTLAGGAVPANHWVTGQELEFTYDGTNWLVGVGAYAGSIGPLATTSGASVDFPGIPAWATEIEIKLDGVSGTSGSLRVQLGTSGGVETTGYLNYTSHVTSAATAVAATTTGFNITFVDPADAARGVLTLKRFSPSENLWILSGVATTGSGAGAAVQTASGAKTLAAQLDRVRIASSSGTLDAGRATVIYR